MHQGESVSFDPDYPSAHTPAISIDHPVANNIPSTLRVGPMIYHIEMVPNLRINNNLRAEILYGEHIIRIDSTMGEQGIYKSLWHEIIHAIHENCGHHAVMTERIPEEVLIDGLAYGIIAVLNDNPWLRSMT